MQLGRARLALALPRHRKQLREARDHRLYGLFEEYARASSMLTALQRELPPREGLIASYEQTCLDLQADVLGLLGKLNQQMLY